MVQTLVNNAGSGVSDDAVAAFAASISGKVMTPGDPGYDETRHIFNGMIDRKPGMIAQPASTSDVQKCINFARENGLLVSVNCGGHSVQGYGVCDGGLMMDLGLMKVIEVDPAAQIAVADGGVNWGEFDAATQEHGLAVTGGRNPTTGIAGLTLGSGSGWLERKLGYTVDNLLACEVVLANGEVINASEDENQELFWGLRGGGGNFGIVTKFTYKLHKIGPTIFGGQLALPRNPAALKAYRDFMETAPDDFCGAAGLVTAPHEEFVPEPVRGMPVMGFIICWTGDIEKGPEAIKPLVDLGVAVNMVEPMPYVALQAMLEPGQPSGVRNYWKADFYPELPDEAIDTLLAAAAEPPSPLSAIIVQPNGGAVQRVPAGATAMGWRSAKWALHILSVWEDPADDEKNIAWTRNIAEKMKPWAQEAAYLNYLMDEGQERVEASFGKNYGRMVALKDKYDPKNFFRLNQNIRPSK
jgi:FAD/FMN-containing dehydrogenase